MRVMAAALLLMAGLLAGCLDPNEIGDTDAVVALPSDVWTYHATSSAQTNTTPATSPALGTPWWQDTGFNGAEPTMGITRSGALFATGGDEAIRSLDGGKSWEAVMRIGFEETEGTPGTAYGSWDPMMWYDKWTDRIYYDPMFPPLLCTQLSWTEDDGESWMTNPAVCHPPPMDHQKLFSGPPGPDAPAIAGAAHPTVLYQCYNQVIGTNCGISYNGGLDWAVTTRVAHSAIEGCGGTNGHGVVSDKGIAVLPLGTSCDEMTLAVSTDSGLEWKLVQVPGGRGTYGFDFDVVFDANETLYVLFEGDDYRMHLARSHDYGETWEGPFDVTPPGVASVFFQTMNVGADGRLAMSFLGTRTHADNPNEAPADTRWHLYMVTTEDRDAAALDLIAYQVTPDDDPMHLGIICTGGIGCDTGRDLLEFIDSAVSPDGTFHVIYTDSCSPECAATKPLDQEAKDGRHLTLARLDGWPMGGDATGASAS